MRYNIIANDKGESLLVVFADGRSRTISNTHAKYEIIKTYLLETDTEALDEIHLADLIDVAAAVGTTLKNLSERVSFDGSNLYFDGDLINNSVSGHIVRMVRDGDKQYVGLVRFLEKISSNPSDVSRKSLYSWLQGRKFTITVDGDFLAYKGVTTNSKGRNVSITSGIATVNGQVVKGQIPNPIRGIIEMPRSRVNADTFVGCSAGLHAGTWDYAHHFGRGRTLVVKINPRDVVSVPVDCESQKLRVCRYVVVEEKVSPYEVTSWDEDDDYYEDDYDEGETEANQNKVTSI